MFNSFQVQDSELAGTKSVGEGLSLQFRLAYNNYCTDYNFEAYREIHGYDFQSVTKDFFDARLYLDGHSVRDCHRHRT